MATRRSRRSRRIAAVLATTSLLLAAAGALHAATRSLPASTPPITPDGRFEDWAQVLAQGAQVSVDGNGSATGAGCFPTNPDRDCVGNSNPGRDVLRAATTWDATYLYVFLARGGDYQNNTHFAFVLDLDADGLLKATDKVLDITWNGGGTTTLSKVEVLDYVPSNPQGDPLECPSSAACPPPGAVGLVDGYSLPGKLGTSRYSQSNVPGAAPNGGRCEARIPWSVLGVGAGTPLLWHLSVSQDGKLSAALDNVGGPDGKAGRVGVFAAELTPDRDGTASSPGTATYCHTLQNRGQFQDRYNLSAVSTSGSAVALYTDAGGCTPGTLVAVDANGDGDFVDPGDTRPAAAWDVDTDGRPDLLLSGGASASWVVQVRVPVGLAGAVETTAVQAQSTRAPAVSARTLETTRVGPLALGPDLSLTAAAGSEARFGPLTLTNTGSPSLAAALVAGGLQGWPRTLRSDAGGTPGAVLAVDADGDGAWDGAAGPFPGLLGAGQAWRFWVVVNVPAGAAADVTGVLDLRATSASAQRAPGRAEASLQVRPPLELFPSYSGVDALRAAAGGVVFFPQRLVNSLPQADSVRLSSGTALPAGYALRWFSDPNGDGNPSDGTEITAAVSVPGNGGSVPVVTAVTVPDTGAGAGVSATTLATGTASLASARTDVTVTGLFTTADPLGALHALRFPPCATVYAQATGLSPGTVTTYQVRRSNPAGATVDTVPLLTDAQGTGSVSFPSWSAAPAGSWQLSLLASGSVVAQLAYTVEPGASLQVDAPAQAWSGDAFAVDARTRWSGVGLPLWDGSVVFDVLDPALGLVTSLRTPLPPVTARSSATAWGARAALPLSSYGLHTVQARWESSCGGTLASGAAQFPVAPPPPSLSSPLEGALLSTSTPTLRGTSLPGATTTAWVDGVALPPPAGTSWSAVTPLLADGAHRWTAAQTVLGAASEPAAEQHFNVDTLAPISRISSPASGSLTRTAPIRISGTAQDATSGVVRVEVSVNGGPWAAASGTGAWTWDFTPPGDGAWGLASRAVDAAGNVESPGTPVVLRFDATPPETLLLSTPPADASSASADFTFAASESPSTFECSVDGTPFSPCSPPFHVPALVDGPHVLQVRATDSAGNTDATPAGFSWRVDTAAPAVSWVEHPPTLDGSASATFRFSASEPLATFECALDGEAFSACTSPRTWSGLADGTHAARVRAVDPAGNVSADLRWAWEVDTAAPTASLGAPTPGAHVRELSWAVTGTAVDRGPGVARVELSVEGGPFTAVAGTTNWQATVTAAGEGPVTLQVRAVDLAGNVQSPPASVTVVVDLTAPDTRLTRTPGALTRETSATFDFASTEPGTFECALDALAWTPCTAPLLAASLADGAHVIAVRAVDQAGNVDGTPARFGWTVDTVAPSVTPSPVPEWSNNPSISLVFTASEAATFECSLDGGPPFACNSPVLLGGLGDGPHGLSVTPTDAAGNTGAAAGWRWSVDTVAPTVTFALAPPAWLPSHTATLSFASSEAASLECSLDGRAFGPCGAPCSVGGLAEGDHRLEVRATDPAGNTGPPASTAWTVDTVPPTTTLLRTPAAVDSSTVATFEFGASEPNPRWRCVLDGTYAVATCDSPASFPGLSDGAHVLELYARDAAGNEDPTGARWEWTVDTSLPDTLVLAAPPAWSASATAVLLWGSTANPAAFECSTDGAPFSPCGARLELASLSEGGHVALARSSNAAGTWDPTPARVTWTVDETPPAAPVLSPVPAATSTPPLGGTSEPGSELSWTLDGSPLPAPTLDPTGRFSGAPLLPLAEGTHRLEASSRDSAGNVGPTAVLTFTTDTVPPSVRIAAGPPSPWAHSDASVTFQVEDSGPATASCRVDGAPWSPCSAPATVTALSDGNHLFEVRAADWAGNLGPAAQWSWHVDTQPPALRFTAAPTSPAASRTATFGLEADEPSTLECALDGAETAACTPPWTLSALADGQHTVLAVAVDAAGNRSAPVSWVWTVDGTPPVVTWRTTPPPVSPSAAALFDFTASEPRVTYTCTLDGAAAGTCSAPWTTAGLADGAHDVRVQALDEAGNPSAPAACHWTVDTQPPALVLDAAPPHLDASPVAHFAFTVSEPADVSCTVDGAQGMACTDPWELAPLPDGDHEVSLQPRDVAGNTGGAVRWQWHIDTRAPAAPALAPIASADPSPSLGGTAEPGATVELWVDGVPAGSATADRSGQFLLTLPVDLADGAHVVEAVAVDAAGNAGPASSQPFITDTRPPTASFTGTPPALSASSMAPFRFTADEPAHFACALDGAPATPCSSPMLAGPLPDGPHALSVLPTDAAGNRGTAVAYAWRVDTTAPSVTVTSAPGPLTHVPQAEVAFTTSEDGVRFECSADGAPPSECTSPLGLASLLDGPHSLEVSATDAAGNTGPTARVAWTQDTVAPWITVVAAPPLLTDAAQAAVAFTTSEPSAVGCSLDGAPARACASPALLEGLADGAHVLVLSAVDAAGNAGPPVTVHWEVDSAAPAEPLLRVPSATTSTPLLEGTAEPLSWVQVTVDGSDTGQARADASGRFGLLPPAPLAEGPHQLEATARDAAGNTSLPAHLPFLTDTVAPTVSITFGPPALDAQELAAFRFTASEPAQFLCALDGAPPSPCTAPTLMGPLADGPHQLAVSAVDVVGNAGPAATWSWSTDAHAPVVTLTATPPQLSSSSAAAAEWTVSEPADSECALDSGGWATCSSPLHLQGLADGTHGLAVRAVDRTGNRGAEVTASWDVDTTPPDTQLVRQPAPLVGTSVAELDFTSEPGATFECSMDGAPFTACVAPVAYPSTPDGPHHFEVRAVDAAGNADPTPADADWQVDTRVPDTSIAQGPDEGTVQGEDVAFAFTSSLPDATFECDLDDAGFQPCAAAWTLTRLSTAQHALQVRSVNPAGVVDPTPAGRGWLTDPDELATRKIRVGAPNCGCTGTGAALPWWGLGLLALARRRKAEGR